MSYAAAHPAELAWRLGQHVELTCAALALSLAIALPLGILVARKRRLGALVLSGLNVIYTIPSLALFALLIPLFGIGRTTALIALVAYAQMILVRNVAVGLRGVPAPLVEAARGLGMTPWQIFRRVEVPAALPVILNGIRIATIVLIALASLAAWIDAGGLGTLMFYGMEHDVPDEVVAGSLAAALLAIVADVMLRALERKVARGAH